MIPPEAKAREARTTIGQLVGALARKEFSACDLADRCLAAATDPAGQGGTIFVAIDASSIRSAAQGADVARAAGQYRPSLAGIPVAIKDLFDVVGEDTCAGSVAPVTVRATQDAAAVQRLRAAGMVPFGRTNMTEFAYSGLGLNPHHGTPLSPWRREERHIAGGSTSGGAAAVADGIVPAALGSDTGGSCRIPAAFCGLVGFKPTAMRVPRAGMVPLSTSLDSVGWIANSVDCCIALDAILANEAPAQARSDIAGARFLVPINLVFDGAEPSVVSAFERSCARLREEGAQVDFCPVPSFDRMAKINAAGGFTAAESFAWHRNFPTEKTEKYDPRVRSRIARGADLSAADYIDMLNQRRSMIDEFEANIRDYDAVIFPTVPILPPKLCDLADDDCFGRINLLVLRNSTLVNMVDGCAINLPMVGAGGPAGITVAGANGQDREILGIAAAIEASLGQSVQPGLTARRKV